MIRICISGLGKTGRQIARYLLESHEAVLVSAICSPTSPNVGRDVCSVIDCQGKPVPIYSSDRIEQCVFSTRPDVLLDFSTPTAAAQNAEVFARLGVPIVMATTGFTPHQEARLRAGVLKYNGGMIYAPNITRGVNTMMLLAEFASRILSSYDVEIIEMHHSRKRDNPSGTAKKLADALADSRQGDPQALQVDIPISSVRAGGIVGSHKVLFVGENDMIEITHQSFSRDAFAEGALFAARYIRGRAGIYEMRDAMNYDAVIQDFLAGQTGVREFPAKQTIGI